VAMNTVATEVAAFLRNILVMVILLLKRNGASKAPTFCATVLR